MYDLRVKAADGLDAPARDRCWPRSTGFPTRVWSPPPRNGWWCRRRSTPPPPTQTILVPGRLIGVDVAGGGPRINTVWVRHGDGRTLDSGDEGAGSRRAGAQLRVVLRPAQHGFATQWRARRCDYVGRGLSPEYFFVVTDDGSFFAEANFAAVFAPLRHRPALAGRPGRVNDLVIRLRPGTDVDAARRTSWRPSPTAGSPSR